MNLSKKYLMSLKKRIRLFFNKRFYIKNVGNTKFLLDIVNRVDRHIDVSGSYESTQVKYFFNLLKNNNCSMFCDVGAHWGYYSVLAAKQFDFKELEIHAFEPDAINRYQLYANLFLNKLVKKVNVHDYGISNYNGQVAFHNFHEGNRGRSHISTDGDSTIDVRRMDDVLSVKNKKIAIKIDVEGHEVSAVSGMSELLKNNQCVLQIESFGDELPSLSKEMKLIGYKKINSIESDHYYSNIENIEK